MLTVLLSLLVTVGAVGTAAYLRNRADAAAQTPPPTQSALPSTPGCRVEPCQVLATADVASTRIELVADAGGKSGRLRIGGTRLVESTITERGAVLTEDSLQCVAAIPAACIVRGVAHPGAGVVGEIVIGRSGKWSLAGRGYASSAGHLTLVDINGHGAPEIIAVQVGFYAQVFAMDSTVMGCTKSYSKIEQLPGWPAVKPDRRELKPCP